MTSRTGAGSTESISDLIDEVGPEIVGPALVAYEGMLTSTSFRSYRIALVNEIGDTLFCTFDTRSLISSVIPFWTISYGEAEFRTFNAHLSRMLTQLLPDDRTEWVREETVDMLYAVAWQMGLGRWE